MLRGWNIQTVRHQFSDLTGRTSFIILYFSQGGDRTPDAFGKLFASESKSIAALAKPFTEHQGGIHFHPLCENPMHEM
jgi:hypothetical protein